jgi:hypothetical protein
LGTWWEQKDIDGWVIDWNKEEFDENFWEQKKFSIQEAIGWDVQNHRAGQPTRANVDTLFEAP